MSRMNHPHPVHSGGLLFKASSLLQSPELLPPISMSDTMSSRTPSVCSTRRSSGLSHTGSVHLVRLGSHQSSNLARKEGLHVLSVDSTGILLSGQSQTTPTDLGKDRIDPTVMPRESLLAHQLHSKDINFQEHQNSYLNSHKLNLKYEDLYSDYLLVAPDVVPGYSLLSPVASDTLSSLLFFASQDGTANRVVIRLSPNYLESAHVARFLNEWHATSGINPTSKHRLWGNSELHNQFIGSDSVHVTDKTQRNMLKQPLTLPKGLLGVLYPYQVLNIEPTKENIQQRRMAMIYEDHGYQNIRDYYYEKSRHFRTETASLRSGSARSVFSELSASDVPLRDRLRQNVAFDELANRIAQSPKSPQTIISILTDVVYVVNVITTCHELGVVHNGITSHNILRANIAEGSVSPLALTGWDFSFTISAEDSSLSFRKSNLSDISDLLPYMSPENLGEITALVDYRADFYSLGIVLYELLVGCLPLQSDSPARLKKMIFVQRPIAPVILGSQWINQKLSDITMKCLEKDPGKRYQDGNSLMKDLQDVINDYIPLTSRNSLNHDLRTVTIDETKIGKVPFFLTNFIKIEDEVRRDIQKCFNAHDEGLQYLMVTGESGVGKSTIIQALKVLAVSKFNYVIHWNYNCTDMKVSKYAFLLNGIHSIIGQILASSRETISEWRHILATEVDTDVSVMFDAIPNLEILMGPRYSDLFSKKRSKASYSFSAGIRSTEDEADQELLRKNHTYLQVKHFDERSLNIELKYKYIIKKIYSIVANRGLTIILDDLHWCSLTEVLLLQEVMEYCLLENASTSISILCAYRTSPPESTNDKYEVELSRLASLFQSQNALYHEFCLKPLHLKQFSKFVDRSKFLNLHDSTIEKIHKATGGNLLQLEYFTRWVRLLHPIGKADFNEEKESLRLLADIPVILPSFFELCITNTARSLLKFASIIGTNGNFRIADLLIVSGLSLTEVYELIQLCLETRVIIPSGIYYKVPLHLITKDDFPFDISDSIVWELATESSYHFDHDLIQIYLLKEMQDSGELENLRRLCGLRYFKKLSGEHNTNINDFLIMANHFLHSCAVAKEDETDIYYEALISGGKFAISSSNAELALIFFEASAQFIKADDQEKQIRNMLTVCHINYLLKRYNTCITLIQEADRIFGKESSTFLYLKIKCLFQLRNFKLGLRKTLDVLASLDVEVSIDFKECNRISEKFFRKTPLSIADIRNMKLLQAATSKKFLLIADLILEAIGPTYVLGLSSLRLALLTQLILLMLKFGTSSSCIVPLLHLGNYFAQRNKNRNILKTKELGEVAIAILRDDKLFSSYVNEQINEAYNMFMAIFKENMSTHADPESLYRLFGTGIVETCDTAMSLMVTMSQISICLSLGGISSRYLNLIKRRKVNFETDDENLVFQNAIKLWFGEMSFEDYKTQFSHFKSLKRYDLEFIYLAQAVLWCSSAGKHNEASEVILKRASHVLKQLPITPFYVEYQFHAVICLCWNTSSSREEGLLLAAKIAKSFDICASVCSANFEAKSLILDACLRTTRPNESSLVLLDTFEDAIEIAGRENSWLDSAIANHLCASWLFKTNQKLKRINHYAQNAYSIYSTMRFYDMAENIKKEFPSSFDNFNWAGVAKIELEPKNFSDSRHFANVVKLPLQRHDVFSDDSNRQSKTTSDKWSNAIRNEGATSENDQGASQHELSKAIKLSLAISESSNADSIYASLLESVLLISGLDYGAIILNNEEHESLIQAIATYNNLYKIESEPLSSRTDLVPYTFVVHCLMRGETMSKEHNAEYFEHQFGSDEYFVHNPCSSVLCIPIKTSNTLGVLYLEKNIGQRGSSNSQRLLASSTIDLLELLCAQAAVSLTKAFLYSQLEAAKKAAEDATAEKGSFLANMSHEIRTPFNSLFACSLFLLDTELTSTQQEYVETIKNSSLVTLNIIDGILAFSKIEHGSFTLNSTPFSIVETVESAIQISSEQASNNGLELVYFNQCPEIDRVIGDPTRVRQIVINLVGNAVKFTLEGYVKICISADKVTENRYMLHISVKDTGIGIPEGLKSKVFGAFSQVDGSSRRVHGGAGLGLAISLKLAHIMDGKISLDSKEGVGSTFCFSCPFEVPNKKTQKPFYPFKVTIILKEKLTRESLREFLEYFGTTVIIKEDGDLRITDEPDLLFVGKSILDDTEFDTKLISSLKTKIVLVTSFGLVYQTDVLEQMQIGGVIFTPIKRTKVETILRSISLGKSTRHSKLIADLLPNSTPNKKELLGEMYPLRILLAEDNPVNLRVASQHLKKLGYKADHAKDGVEVLEICESLLSKREKYDVILMDIQMPRKDGIVASLNLRESLSTRNLMEYMPMIVALTANVAGEDRERCLMSGMVDFISKPILPEELLRVLKKVARHEYDNFAVSPN